MGLDDLRSDKERLRLRTTCKHYNGTQHETCEAGINYRLHVWPLSFGWATKLPCMPEGGFCDREKMVPCEQYEARGEEAVRESDRQFEEALRLLDQDQSPCCKAPLDRSQLVTSGRHKGSGWLHCSTCKKAVCHVHA